MLKRIIITAGLILSFAFVSFAQVPQYVNYQGMLSDATGNSLTGNYTINFRIYDASAGGNLLWGPQTSTVNADAGLFSVELGPIEYSVFDGSERWLSLQVGSDAEMTPRKRLLSVGNSYRAYDADKVDGKDASAFVQTGQANSISTGMIQTDAVTRQKVLPDIVSSLDGVSNDGGNIDLVGGGGVTITPDDTNNKITISASTSGDNLGNHRATQNIRLNGNWLSNDGGNEGIKVSNSGNVNASGDVVAGDHLWAVNGPVVAENGHIRTGVTKPADVGGGDIYAKDDLIAGDQVKASSAYISGKVGIGTSSPSAKLDVKGDIYATWGNGNYGVLGGANKSVYGKYNNGSEGWLGGSSYGAYGKKGSSFGYLGSSTIGAYGEGTTYGVYGKKGNYYGYLGGSNYGVYGKGGGGSSGHLGGGSYAVYGDGGSGGFILAGWFEGTVHVNGQLSKSAGSFKIDHPLDPANKYLYHSFVESPDMKNIYDGVVRLDSRGEATVELPDWFEALNKDFRYQLTAIGAPGPNLYIAEKISNNSFKIAGGKAAMEVSWHLTGIRKDAYASAHRIKVEVEKPAGERGKYLHPVEHGASETLGMNYEERMSSEAENRRMEVKESVSTEK